MKGYSRVGHLILDKIWMGRLHLLVDDSSSMITVNQTVYDGAVEIINGLKEEDEVCISKFSNEVTLGETMKKKVALENMKRTHPNGCTCLYDGICKVVKYEYECHSDCKETTIVILTDGNENSSKEYKREDVCENIKLAETNGWRIVFLGSNQDAVLTAKTLGIPKQNSLTYGNNPASLTRAFTALSDSMSRRNRGEDASFTDLERQESMGTPENSIDIAIPMLRRAVPFGHMVENNMTNDARVPNLSRQ